MATERKRGQHLRPMSGTISDDERHYLLTGHDFFSQGFDDERMKALWEQHRDELIAQHREEHGLGTRCWGWWKFDAPEPRRILRGPGNVTPPAIPKALYESEAAYLNRLGLLTGEEQIKLTLRDFQSADFLPVQYKPQMETR